jgi:membrane-associated phospholipid phosphatase
MSLSEIDSRIFSHINITFQNDLFDVLMPFITSKAYLIFLPLFIWILYKERKNALIILGIALSSLLVADWFANELKLSFERIRPCNALDNVRLLVGCGRSFSFPSNHAVNAFAFATPFYLMTKGRARAVFFFVALLVGFSRVYVGVHYPSDVIAGALFGTLMAFIVMRCYRWASIRFKDRPHTTLLILFLSAFSLFRLYYILHGSLDLSPDEAHYWEWSRRLDMSYYSKGPMIAYLISLGTSIFGDTILGIRIMAMTFLGASSIAIFYLGKKLYDETVGLASALMLNVIPLFATFGIIFTIDSPFIFFWILSLFLFWKTIEFRTNEANNAEYGQKEVQPSAMSSSQHETKHAPLMYWVLLGISVGLGLLTKYTMALFYPCALLYLFLSKEFRKTLLTKGPLLMLLISLLLFSPVIVWNAHHDWVTFRHTLGQTHLPEGLNISPGTYTIINMFTMQEYTAVFIGNDSFT